MNKKTIYALAGGTYRNFNEEIIKVEKGFADPELHTLIDGKYKEYKVKDVVGVDEFTKKVIYEFKLPEVKIIEMKFEDGIKLTTLELEKLVCAFPKIHEEEGPAKNGEVAVLTVVEVNSEYYAVEWKKDATGLYEDIFEKDPYKVKVEEKEIVVTKKIITAL